MIGAIAKSNDADFLTAVLNPSYAPFFAGGMVLYLIHAYGHSVLRWLLLFFNVCLGVQQADTGWVSGSIPRNTGTDPSHLVGAVLIVGIFAVVALVTVSPLKYKGPAWLTVAGALTYPLYLVHEAWGWFMIQELHDVVSNKWVLLSLTVATVLVVAWLIHRFVERPVGPWLNKALKRDEVARRGSGRRVADTR